MGLIELLGKQSRKPSGLCGKILGHSMAWGHKPLTNWAIAFMDIQPTDHVLDIGCGSGMAVKLISRIAIKGFVAGLDYSEEMVQQALRRNVIAVRAGRVTIEHGSVSSLPYDDASFDKVCTIEAFYFWPDPIGNLKEVRRVLKPGGRIIIAMEGSKEVPNWQKSAALAARMGFPLYSGVETEEMLTAAGFGRAWFEAAPHKGWGWLCSLGVK